MTLQFRFDFQQLCNPQYGSLVDCVDCVKNSELADATVDTLDTAAGKMACARPGTTGRGRAPSRSAADVPAAVAVLYLVVQTL